MTTKLPINFEDLLRQRTVEGEDIEHTTVWNPDALRLCKQQVQSQGVALT